MQGIHLMNAQFWLKCSVLHCKKRYIFWVITRLPLLSVYCTVSYTVLCIVSLSLQLGLTSFHKHCFPNLHFLHSVSCSGAHFGINPASPAPSTASHTAAVSVRLALHVTYIYIWYGAVNYCIFVYCRHHCLHHPVS